MADNSDKSIHQDMSLFDDAYADKENMPQMDLPDDPVLFEESQPFDQSWIWILLGFETVAILLPLILTGQAWWVIMIAAVIMVMTMSLMSSLKLQTRIDDEGIHYRMVPFHWKQRTIRWDEVEQVNVRTYSPMIEYGGWGLRYGRNGNAVNVRGNLGIQVVKKNGKRILIGTQLEDQAKKALENRPVMV